MRLKEWLEAEQADRSEVVLAPLSNEDSGRLIESRSSRTGTRPSACGSANAPTATRCSQEFAAAVLDRDGFEIPTSLQALFVARLDDLDEDSRHTLQLASVIGRTFSESVLRTIKEGDIALAADARASRPDRPGGRRSRAGVRVPSQPRRTRPGTILRAPPA